ncbi:MAG TPA: hypothetical protein DCG12_18215 [Planctomycetaceae bacterium]|nr:hypothetical protein [Planctomycetaceae bacterium]
MSIRLSLFVITFACVPVFDLVEADESDDLRQLLTSHCADCHSGDSPEAGIVLSAQSSKTDLSNPYLLRKLISVLEDRRMPPRESTELPAKLRGRLLDQFQTQLNKAVTKEPFGRIPVRRMNRFQYNNAVVDLLKLDRELFRMNERLMRRRNNYFQPQTGKMPESVLVSCRPLSKDIDNQRPEGFRGVTAFPQDKRAEHGFDNRADHLTMSPLLMESFLGLSQSVAASPDLNAAECRAWDEFFSHPDRPVRASSEGRLEAENGQHVRIVNKPEGAVGRQDMSVFGDSWSGNAQLFWQCPGNDRVLELEFNAPREGNGLRMGFSVAGDYGTFDVLLDGKAIRKTVDFFNAGVKHTVRSIPVDVSEGIHRITFKCVGKQDRSARFFFGLDYIDVTTPKAEPTSARSLPEPDVLKTRIRLLLRRAFRRPVSGDVQQKFVNFATELRADGASWEETMRSVLSAVLGSPEFFYLYESPSGSSQRQRLNDFELASRLSQFFWSSIPDDELLDLAADGKLSRPEVLSAQIDRMMNDVRSGRFCENFPAQWLQLDRLVTSVPDQKKYPWFYYFGYRTSMHMMSEPLLLFETVFVENRSIIDLIAPDFTWESPMLKQNYEGTAKSHHEVLVQSFRRVRLESARRGGVITNAAVMTMTSTPTRTQPITRGAWTNAVIFNDPPEPPPADVPPLPEDESPQTATQTIREKLAIHRKRADCAGCHNQIDPLGFALENFGPTGVWRDSYENGRPVDMQGKLFNQYQFGSVEEFKALLVSQKIRFIRGLTGHLLSYALGRELGPADWPVISEISDGAANGEDGLRSLLKAIAMSDSFLHKGFAEPSSN